VELVFIVRDFDDEKLEAHVEYLRGLADEVAATDERSSIELESFIQYRNMRNTLDKHPEIVDHLETAVRRVGLEPLKTPIRGGTDGSALTEMGLPTPNIFTGGQDAHSEREWICVEDMGLAALTVIELSKVWAEPS
jgi:tripeptide aminopeptidase